MKTLGEILLEARLRLGLSLVDCVEFTKISKRAIRHMENDEWNRLRDRATAERLLRAYASFLRLNEAAVLHQFNLDYPEGELIFEEDPEEKAERLRRETALKKKKLRINLILLAFVAVAVFAGTMIYDYVSGPKEDTPPPGNQSGQADGAEPSDGTGAGSALDTTPGESREDMDLTLVGLSDCWVAVAGDGQKLKEGLLTEGESFSFTGIKSLSLRLGSAGGAQVEINGVILEPLGGVGQVARVEIGMKNGVITNLETGEAMAEAGLG